MSEAHPTAQLVAVAVPGSAMPLRVDEARKLVAFRPVVEFFGLDFAGQFTKLNNKSWATVEKFSTVGGDGKTRDMVGVDRRTLGMWLATLDENRVAEERRDDLRAYQSEAADALDTYFHGGVAVDTLDLSDPIAAIEAANTRSQQAIEIAKAERVRADRAEHRVEIEQRHRRAIEGGDGILLTDFGKKYFSDVRQTDFFEHLYKRKWLIDQRNTRIDAYGDVRDGHDHGKPTYRGRPFIYEHDRGTHGGKRRFQSRVRPQRELELRDALAAEGLPVNTHSSGLVLITSAELEKLA